VLAAVALLADVTNRRVRVDPAGLAALAGAAWRRVRGRAKTVRPEYLERLKSSKRAVRTSLAESAARCQPSSPLDSTQPSATMDLSAERAGPSLEPPRLAAEEPAREGYTERLLAAKRRARQGDPGGLQT
jgi:hypothetical protein